MNEFIKGMDISTLYELESLGAKFYDKCKEKDLMDILKDYDINYVRLRLWNDPYSEDGAPYGAGTNDLTTTIHLARRALKRGFGFLLDFHYSDFWTDPGKQIKPKAWRDFSDDELEEAVYQFTKDTLLSLKQENAMPSMVQIGNELTNGLLWPNGKWPEFENITRFINAGIRAVRYVDKSIPVMIHLDNGGNNQLYREWFDNFMKKGEDFEIIGLSYYPFWHGTLADLEYNMNDIAARYHKDLIVAEVSMGYTLEDYRDYENLAKDERKGMAAKSELAAKIEYPMTKKGQSDFLLDFFNRIAKVDGGKGKGYFYWEPAWIPVKGSGWATKESLDYMNERGPCGNEWANQALFDYDGNALPSLQVINDFKSGEIKI